SAIGLAIAWAMVEPPAQADEILADDAASLDDRAITSRRSEPIGQLGSLLALIAPAAVVHAASSAGTFFVRSASDRGPAEATILIAIVTLAEAAGSLVASRMTAGVRTQ